MTEPIHSSPPVELDFFPAPLEPPSPAARLAWLLGARARGPLEQFLRYAVVGGIATVADFGTLVLAKSGLGLHYLVANALGFCVGLVTCYALSILWVFSERSLKSPAVEFAIFAVIGVLGLGISQLCMIVGVEWAGAHYTLAKVGAVFCTLMWNFFIRKGLLFRERDKK